MKSCVRTKKTLKTAIGGKNGFSALLKFKHFTARFRQKLDSLYHFAFANFNYKNGCFIFR